MYVGCMKFWLKSSKTRKCKKIYKFKWMRMCTQCEHMENRQTTNNRIEIQTVLKFSISAKSSFKMEFASFFAWLRSFSISLNVPNKLENLVWIEHMLGERETMKIMWDVLYRSLFLLGKKSFVNSGSATS